MRTGCHGPSDLGARPGYPFPKRDGCIALRWSPRYRSKKPPEWLANRTERGWAVTLLNPAGQPKPQQGIVPTDFRESRAVVIRSSGPVKFARDRLLPGDVLTICENAVRCEVPAGGVRIFELR